MNTKIRCDFISGIEAEIREEMASALGRIGKRLEALIAELVFLRNHLASCSENEKEQIIQKYKHTRKEARLYYSYLIVQRESIGLRNHELLRELYPIPELPH